MHCHLVAVKVSIECRANQGMQLNGTAFDQLGFKSLNTQTVQGRCPVQQDRTAFNGFIQRFPYFWSVAFDQPFGSLDIGCKPTFLQDCNHKGTEQFQSHFLWQTALGHFQFGTGYDYGTSGVINSFSKQVPAEAAFLAFEHIAERL